MSSTTTQFDSAFRSAEMVATTEQETAGERRIISTQISSRYDARRADARFRVSFRKRRLMGVFCAPTRRTVVTITARRISASAKGETKTWHSAQRNSALETGAVRCRAVVSSAPARSCPAVHLFVNPKATSLSYIQKFGRAGRVLGSGKVGACVSVDEESA